MFAGNLTDPSLRLNETSNVRWNSTSAPEEMTFLGMPAIVSSPRMSELLKTVRRAAQTSATVLITGESGSGKEVVARAIHHYSPRQQRPWVDFSCAALPEHLVESELFGYEKGAFSGAEALKPGLFELAQTGSLLLDEVGELNERLQVKLLRVLDGAPYYRLGGTKKISVDARIIAATNRDLNVAMTAGTFRTDLYHRLNQIQIAVPPLRERVEDIGPLAYFFLRQQNSALQLSARALQAMFAYQWPGNVRELRNAILKASIQCRDEVIDLTDLPESVRTRLAVLPANASDALEAGTLENMEKQLILQMMSATNGNQKRVAGLLGISGRTLSRKLKLYGWEPAHAPARDFRS